jgi:hypothetical protein
MRLAAVQHFDNLLRAIRILAVTRCPDPLHHRAVAQYCLSPLALSFHRSLAGERCA